MIWVGRVKMQSEGKMACWTISKKEGCCGYRGEGSRLHTQQVPTLGRQIPVIFGFENKRSLMSQDLTISGASHLEP